MNQLIDSKGKPLPESESPSAQKLRAYGDFMFLAFRSQWHMQICVRRSAFGVRRSAFEPALALSQYRIFRFDDVPRGLITWAWLNDAAERKYVAGELLDPEDWYSGDRLWLIDMIAPYNGLTASMTRWIMEPGHFATSIFKFRRVGPDRRTRKIVSIDLSRPDDKARILTEASFFT